MCVVGVAVAMVVAVADLARMRVCVHVAILLNMRVLAVVTVLVRIVVAVVDLLVVHDCVAVSVAVGVLVGMAVAMVMSVAVGVAVMVVPASCPHAEKVDDETNRADEKELSRFHLWRVEDALDRLEDDEDGDED